MTLKVKFLVLWVVSLSVVQNEKTLYKVENSLVSIDSDELTFGMKRIALSMKRGEQCFADIQAGFLERNEKFFCERIGMDYKQNGRVYMELHNFMRVEDYFHDDSTLRKVYKKGKRDSNPYMESTVECKFLCNNIVKIKVLVNDVLKFSNLDIKPLVPERKKEFLQLTDEVQEKILPENPPILKYKLDEYKLPPMITKGVREMDCEELVELGTTRVEKLVPYFKEEEIMPAEWFKKGDRVRIFLYLINTDRVCIN